MLLKQHRADVLGLSIWSKNVSIFPECCDNHGLPLKTLAKSSPHLNVSISKEILSKLRIEQKDWDFAFLGVFFGLGVLVFFYFNHFILRFHFEKFCNFQKKSRDRQSLLSTQTKPDLLLEVQECSANFSLSNFLFCLWLPLKEKIPGYHKGLFSEVSQFNLAVPPDVKIFESSIQNVQVFRIRPLSFQFHPLDKHQLH